MITAQTTAAATEKGEPHRDSPAQDIQSASSKGRFSRYILRFHRWVGVLFGIQVFLWMISGVIMSWFHINLVRGDTYATEKAPTILEAYNYVAPGGILANARGAVSIEITKFLGQPVYLTKGNGQDHMYDALTGERLSPIKQDKARLAAESDYAGDAQIDSIRMMTKPPAEYRGPTPVWQITYKDDLNTRLYISPNTGKVVARRNKIWRLYDFFWMLHIMDYEDREDFNNPLIKAASATGLAFVVSGIILLLLRLRRGIFTRDLHILVRKTRKNN